MPTIVSVAIPLSLYCGRPVGTGAITTRWCFPWALQELNLCVLLGDVATISPALVPRRVVKVLEPPMLAWGERQPLPVEPLQFLLWNHHFTMAVRFLLVVARESLDVTLGVFCKLPEPVIIALELLQQTLFLLPVLCERQPQNGLVFVRFHNYK